MVVAAGLAFAASAADFPEAVPGDIELPIGQPAAQSFLGFGWDAPEWNDGHAFRWITHMEADVWFELSSATNLDAWIEAQPVYTGQQRQLVGFLFNGRLVAEHRFENAPTYQVFRFPVPAARLRPGRNRLILRMSFADSVGADPRNLALAVRRILFRPMVR